MQYFGFDRPSFGIKTFGFGESSPKLQANFITGTYKASGAAKTFADLFTFTRAGKAWLVKDTGLQEYAADVPRLDNGLLIERAVTNLFQNNKTYNSYTSTMATKEILASSVKFTTTQDTTTYGILRDYPAGTGIIGATLKTILVKKGGARYVSLRQFSAALGVTLDTTTGELVQKVDSENNKVVDLGDWYLLSVVTVIGGTSSKTYDVSWGNAISGTFDIVSKIGDYIEIAYPLMASTNEVVSTTIVTGLTPVTRPADFLLNKITGTTVTGDWDSTLTLSIVAGNLVHSGYGRIRSLEIN